MDETEPHYPYLAANTLRLLNGRGISSVAAELRIGNSTIQRMKAGKSVEIKSIDKFARAHGTTAIAMLMPPKDSAAAKFRDLDALEGKLVDLFREVTDENVQLELLTAFNKLVTDAGFGNGASNPYAKAPPPGAAVPKKIKSKAGPKDDT